MYLHIHNELLQQLNTIHSSKLSLKRDYTIFDWIMFRIVERIPLKEKPMHSPSVPPTDPIIFTVSKTKCSLYTVVNSGVVNL